MACRITRLAMVASLVSAAPVVGQGTGAVELGAFARYTNFDNSLGMSSTVGAGGRVSVALRPGSHSKSTCRGPVPPATRGGAR